MNLNFKKIKDDLLNRTFFMGTAIVAMTSCYIHALDDNKMLAEKLIYQQDQTKEVSIMLFNTKLEKLDYIEKEKQKINQAQEDEKEEISEKIFNVINNKYREVHYKRDINTSKIVEVDFSQLNISCDTYNKFLPTQQMALTDAKFVNSNCEGN